MKLQMPINECTNERLENLKAFFNTMNSYSIAASTIILLI
jgi:hypothetical protein